MEGRCTREHENATADPSFLRMTALWCSVRHFLGGSFVAALLRMTALREQEGNFQGSSRKFEPKASRRPSQSFTTNSRECHGMLPSSRVNSTPLAVYSA